MNRVVSHVCLPSIPQLMLTVKHLVNESYLRPRFKLDCEQTLFVKHTAARSDVAKSNVEQVVNFSDRMLLYPLTQNRRKSHQDFFCCSNCRVSFKKGSRQSRVIF